MSSDCGGASASEVDEATALPPVKKLKKDDIQEVYKEERCKERLCLCGVVGKVKRARVSSVF